MSVLIKEMKMPKYCAACPMFQNNEIPSLRSCRLLPYSINDDDWKTRADNCPLEEIEKLPSAEPEIIRCKDCKWSDWYTAIDGKQYCYCLETGNGGRTENDYCSYAERRTDG